MKIVQCIFTHGALPEEIAECIGSVVSYALVNAHEYVPVVDHSAYDHLRGQFRSDYMFYRAIHELVFLDYLSKEKDVLCIDFDVKLLKGFCVPDRIARLRFTHEYLIYNGEDTTTFQKILESIGGAIGASPIYVAMKTLGIKDTERYFDDYIHYNYSKMRQSKET